MNKLEFSYLDFRWHEGYVEAQSIPKEPLEIIKFLAGFDVPRDPGSLFHIVKLNGESIQLNNPWCTDDKSPNSEAVQIRQKLLKTGLMKIPSSAITELFGNQR